MWLSFEFFALPDRFGHDAGIHWKILNVGYVSVADGQLSRKLTFRLKVCNGAGRTAAVQRNVEMYIALHCGCRPRSKAVFWFQLRCCASATDL